MLDTYPESMFSAGKIGFDLKQIYNRIYFTTLHFKESLKQHTKKVSRNSGIGYG